MDRKTPVVNWVFTRARDRSGGSRAIPIPRRGIWEDRIWSGGGQLMSRKNPVLNWPFTCWRARAGTLLLK